MEVDFVSLIDLFYTVASPPFAYAYKDRHQGTNKDDNSTKRIRSFSCYMSWEFCNVIFLVSIFQLFINF